MAGGSTSGPEPPNTKAGSTGVQQAAVGEKVPVIPGADETSSYVITALPGNSSTIWVAWDRDSLEPGNGFPLPPGSAIGNEFDNASAELYFTPESDQDGVAFITVG